MCSKVAGLFACFFPSSGIYCRIFSSFQGNRYLLKYENEVEGIFSYILLNDRKKLYGYHVYLTEIRNDPNGYH